MTENWPQRPQGLWDDLGSLSWGKQTVIWCHRFRIIGWCRQRPHCPCWQFCVCNLACGCVTIYWEGRQIDCVCVSVCVCDGGSDGACRVALGFFKEGMYFLVLVLASGLWRVVGGVGSAWVSGSDRFGRFLTFWSWARCSASLRFLPTSLKWAGFKN